MAFIIGCIVRVNPYTAYFYPHGSDVDFIINPIVYISIPLNTGIHITGLILAIMGIIETIKGNKKKGAQKVGNIFSILGLIINSIGLILIVVIGPLMFLNLLSITTTGSSLPFY